jgi:hypothetical protein
MLIMPLQSGSKLARRSHVLRVFGFQIKSQKLSWSCRLRKRTVLYVVFIPAAAPEQGRKRRGCTIAHVCTDKKEKKFSLIYKEIQMGFGGKVIYEVGLPNSVCDVRKCTNVFTIYED